MSDLHVCQHHMYVVLMEARRDFGSPGAIVTDVC